MVKHVGLRLFREGNCYDIEPQSFSRLAQLICIYVSSTQVSTDPRGSRDSYRLCSPLGSWPVSSFSTVVGGRNRAEQLTARFMGPASRCHPSLPLTIHMLELIQMATPKQKNLEDIV